MKKVTSCCLPVLAALAATAAEAEHRGSADQHFENRVIEVFAGGPDSASDLGTDCVGWISRSDPVHVLDIPVTGYPLAIFVSEDDGVDTTLVVETPEGTLRCNDDSHDQRPGLLIDDPAAGEYRIHVGTYSLENDRTLVRLGISLIDHDGWGTREPDTLLRSELGPDRVVIEGIAGGFTDASTLPVEGCVGLVFSAFPTYAFAWAGAGDPGVRLSVESEIDTTLVIRTPSGEWLCDDDSGGGTGPPSTSMHSIKEPTWSGSAPTT